MSNLYSKVHRLKDQGWTWQTFIAQLDTIYTGSIDEKTLLALYRHPHRRANHHTRQAINQLHQQCFPSPFPADSEALLAVYNRLRQCKHHTSTQIDDEDLLLFLTSACEYGSPLRKARLHWLKADIHLDQLPALRDNARKTKLAQHKTLALAHYQNAYDLLISWQQSGQSPCISDFTLYKVEQNMLACHLNSLRSGQRYNDSTLLDYLANANYIDASKAVLVQEPYQWLVARNGLRFSAIMQHRANCQYFYEALVRANKAFSDPHYSPREAPAIAHSQEFNWAIDCLNLTEKPALGASKMKGITS